MDDCQSADGSPTCRHASSGSLRCTNSFSAAGDRMASDGNVAVSGPIYFLIREQAKSLISIEELRERMKVLEEFQERVMLAIHGIQCQLITEEDSPVSCPPNLQLDTEVTSPANLISNLRGYSHQKQNNLYRTAFQAFQPLPKSFYSDHSGYFNKDLAAATKYQTRNSMLRKGRDNDMDAKESKEVDVLLPNSSLSSTKCDCGKSGESIKEDSGVDSDYRDHGNDFSLQNISSDYCKSFDINGEDELLTLLDKIDQKGTSLRQQMDALEKEQKAQIASGNSSFGQNFDLLLAEKLDLHRQLCEVKAERDLLKEQLDHFQLIIENLTAEKKKLDEKLETILSEKQQLKTRIHGLHGQFVKGSSLQKSEGWLQDDGLTDRTLTREPSIERLGGKGKSMNSQENRLKVSSVLKETNVLELQRQLLTYIMENDVLQGKLQQSGKVTQWEKIAINLKSEMKKIIKEKEDLQIKLDQANLELIASQAKIRMLGKTVNALHLENGVVNFGLSGSVHLLPFQNSRKKNLGNSFDTENENNSRAQSLPVTLVSQKFNMPVQSGNETPHMHNSDSFTNIPLSNSTTLQQLNISHHTDTSDRNSLIDIDGACNSCPSLPSPQQTFSNTPTITLHTPSESQSTLFSSCKPHLVSSSHTSAWDYYNRRHSSCDGLKPTRGHWKNSSQNDLNSICSEFDPLNSESNSGEKFIDSLNPSSPLKGTQLSSIGDSLHSGSLEAGCTLIPWQNSPQSSANGLDTFCAVNSRSQICQKDESFLSYSQSSHHSGKVNSQHQGNLLDCLSSSNDLTLL